MIASLAARVHLLARPAVREELVRFYRETLQCSTREIEPASRLPMALVTFPDGSSMSVEFSEDSPENIQGTWLEFRTSEPARLQERLHEAGTPSFRHPPSPHTYFRAPGGQVFRIVSLEYRGP